MDINKIVEWSERNHLPFNLNECQLISFGRPTNVSDDFDYVYIVHESSLARSTCVKDLGMFVFSFLI